MSPKIPTHLDARGARGRYSRGNARYGVSNAPTPGRIKNIQQAAQKRIRDMQAKAKK